MKKRIRTRAIAWLMSILMMVSVFNQSIVPVYAQEISLDVEKNYEEFAAFSSDVSEGEKTKHEHDDIFMLHEISRVDSTCLTKGYVRAIYSCWECFAEWEDTEELPLADHLFTKEDTGEKYLKAPADTEHANVYYYSCEVCGENEADDAHTFEVGEKLIESNIAVSTNNGILSFIGTGAIYAKDYNAETLAVYLDETTEIIVGDGIEVVEIPFESFKVLKKVSLGADVNLLSEESLCASKTLEEITVSDKNIKYASESGILYNRAFTTLVCFPALCEANYNEIYLEANFRSTMIWPVSTLLSTESISVGPAFIADCVYTGEPIEPKIVVTANYSRWADAEDSYIVKYFNNVEPGIATVTIKFNKRFSGEITKNFLIYKPVELKQEDGVYQISDAAEFNQLKNVINASETGEEYEIKLLADIDTGDSETAFDGLGDVSPSLSIDMNGHSITSNYSTVLYVGNATLELSNGELIVKEDAKASSFDGLVTVDGGTVNMDKVTIGGDPIKRAIKGINGAQISFVNESCIFGRTVLESSELTVEDSIIWAGGGDYPEYGAAIYAVSNSEVIVNSGRIVGGKGKAGSNMENSAIYMEGGRLEINGGMLMGVNYGVHVYGSTALNITGGTILTHGYYTGINLTIGLALERYTGNASISGGTFRSNNGWENYGVDMSKSNYAIYAFTDISTKRIEPIQEDKYKTLDELLVPGFSFTGEYLSENGKNYALLGEIYAGPSGYETKVNHFVKGIDKKYPERPNQSETRLINTATVTDLTQYLHAEYVLDIRYSTLDASPNPYESDELYYESASINDKGEIDIYYNRKHFPEPISVTINNLGENGDETVTALHAKGNMLPPLSKLLDITGIPKRTGYTFAGIYGKDNGQGTMYYSSKGDLLYINEVDEDITLYAHWTPLEYTINFDANDDEYYGNATGSMFSLKVNYGEEKILTPNAYKRAGYTFAGWNTVKHPTESNPGTFFANSGKILNLLDGSAETSITLYAVWEAIDYSITYFTNGGELEGDYAVSYTIEDSIQPLPSPKTIAGFTFQGWFTDKGYTKKITEIKKGTTGSIQLYAKWTVNTLSINFDKCNAEATGTMTGQSIYVDTPTALSANKFTRNKYKFVGWALSRGKAEAGEVDFADKAKVNYADFEETLSPLSNEDLNITLYAVWANTFAIKYNPMGGIMPEGMENTTEYTYGTAKSLAKPTKEGYTFIGWFTDETLTKQFKSVTNTTYGDYELYAKWTPYTYTIKFDANGGTGKAQTQKMTVDKYAALKAISKLKFSRKGYEFVGWAKVKEAGEYDWVIEDAQEVVNVTLRKNKDTVILYAQWEPIDYNIKLNLNGGELEGSEAEYTYNISNSAQSLPVPTRENYTFGGWYKDENFKSKYNSIPAKTAADIELFAKWNGFQYDIVLHDGEKTVTGTGFVHGNTVTIPANSFKKTGYTFTGWSLSADSSTAVYKNKQIIREPECTYEDEHFVFHLYACWSDYYTISYECNGGSCDNPAGYTYGEELNLNPASRSGYIFKGWYKDSKFKKTFSGITTSTSGNIKVYAKWQADTYVINFYPNVDESDSNPVTGSMQSQTLTFQKAKAITANGFVRNGYAFMGWANEPEGEIVYKNKEVIKGCRPDNSYPTDGRLELYAVWRDTFSIVYRLDGGVNPPDAPSSYKYKSGDVKLPTPEKDGYKFSGWYKDSKYKSKISLIESGDSKDYELYAKWTAKSYDVKFVANAPAGTKATGTMKNQKLTFGSAKALTKNAFKVNGYSMLGWAVSPDGEPVLGNSAKLSGFETYASSVTLYAVWEKNVYTINWVNAPGAEFQTEYSVDSEEIILPTPLRMGYTFQGWFTDSKYKNKASNIKKGSTGNKTFYAKWKRN